MKKTGLIIYLSGILFLSGISQVDTIIYSQTSKDTTMGKYDLVYKLFIPDKKEVKHLWKLDLLGYGENEANISFEKKIGKNFSVNSFNSIRRREYVMDYNFCTEASIKYYYNFNRREMLGKINNRFSGNYFQFGLFYNVFKIRYGLNYYFPIEIKKHAQFGLVTNYGIQRSIGNIGFIEAYIGVQLSKFNKNHLGYIPLGFETVYEIKPNAGLKAGFSFESIKELKRKFKN